MNRTLVLISGIALLVIIGAGLFYFNAQSTSDEDAMMQEKAAMESSESMEPKEAMADDKAMMEKDSAMMATGSYVPHAANAVEDAADAKRVLFFYANWCPTCRPVDASLTANTEKIPAGVTVIRVNYNDPETDAAEKALATKYGVTYQHTFVLIDANGNEIKKWNGGGLDEIIAMTK